MKIIIERQGRAEVVIDTKSCNHPWAFREAIQEALQIEGFDKDMINEIFGIMPDVKGPEEPE